jgi:hypothetical protein
MINQKNAWSPSINSPLVPNYPTFPHDPTDPALAAPRASAYVMTTAVKPRAEWPDLLPLYLMDKAFPSGRDFMLVTTVGHIQQAHTDGYSLRTIQGYIYKPCTPEPACIPPAAQKFWRKCKTGDNDCATFLESERLTSRIMAIRASTQPAAMHYWATPIRRKTPTMIRFPTVSSTL